MEAAGLPRVRLAGAKGSGKQRGDNQPCVSTTALPGGSSCPMSPGLAAGHGRRGRRAFQVGSQDVLCVRGGARAVSRKVG